MYWEQPVQYASMSDIGLRRQNNEDALAVRICSEQSTWNRHGHLFLVADGMGGHAVGELASKIATDSIPHTYFKTSEADIATALKQSIEAANANIHERGSLNHDFQRMGTTCASLVLSTQGAVIGHVGDSRVYRVRGQRIDQLTYDHSLQWELLKRGNVDPDNAELLGPRNVITRCLGPETTVQVDIEGPYEVFPDDIYLLCSDGLTEHVNDSEIGVIARQLAPGDACRLLVNLANSRGGSDNITIVIVRVGNIPGGLPSTSHNVVPEPRPAPSGKWLAFAWGIALSFAGGVSLILLGKPTSGMLLAALAFVAMGIFLVCWWQERKRVFAARAQDSDETAVWNAYRTASAEFDSRFLDDLTTVQSELHRAAVEEEWSMDWTEFRKVYEAAQAALQRNDHQDAIFQLARTIDLLMIAVNQQRRQTQHDSKWSRTSSASTLSNSDP